MAETCRLSTLPGGVCKQLFDKPTGLHCKGIGMNIEYMPVTAYEICPCPSKIQVPPPRKTNLEVAVDMYEGPDRAWHVKVCNKDSMRKALIALKVDPDGEYKEAAQ